MRDSRLPVIDDIRPLLAGYTSKEFTFPRIAKQLGISAKLLKLAFVNESGLIAEILNFEQHNLEEIFSHPDFLQINAIDGLLKVSTQIRDNFETILPSINFDLRESYPEVRLKFVERRVSFVNTKIKSNFEQGIQQGLYRRDLSPELISRLYISRLIDLHNPDFFPNESISFQVLFNLMFDTFIYGICTDEGRKYYDQKKLELKF